MQIPLSSSDFESGALASIASRLRSSWPGPIDTCPSTESEALDVLVAALGYETVAAAQSCADLDFSPACYVLRREAMNSVAWGLSQRAMRKIDLRMALDSVSKLRLDSLYYWRILATKQTDEVRQGRRWYSSVPNSKVISEYGIDFGLYYNQDEEQLWLSSLGLPTIGEDDGDGGYSSILITLESKIVIGSCLVDLAEIATRCQGLDGAKDQAALSERAHIAKESLIPAATFSIEEALRRFGRGALPSWIDVSLALNVDGSPVALAIKHLGLSAYCTRLIPPTLPALAKDLALFLGYSQDDAPPPHALSLTDQIVRLVDIDWVASKRGWRNGSTGALPGAVPPTDEPVIAMVNDGSTLNLSTRFAWRQLQFSAFDCMPTMADANQLPPFQLDIAASNSTRESADWSDWWDLEGFVPEGSITVYIAFQLACAEWKRQRPSDQAMASFGRTIVTSSSVTWDGLGRSDRYSPQKAEQIRLLGRQLKMLEPCVSQRSDFEVGNLYFLYCERAMNIHKLSNGKSIEIGEKLPVSFWAHAIHFSLGGGRQLADQLLFFVPVPYLAMRAVWYLSDAQGRGACYADVVRILSGAYERIHSTLLKCAYLFDEADTEADAFRDAVNSRSDRFAMVTTS